MKISKKALSEEKFRTVERRLAEIIADFGYLKGRPAKTSEVMAHIHIHQQVTQKQLREITGYSLGTISSALQELEQWGFVSKHASPNSREYIYSLDGIFLHVLSKSMTSFQEYLSQTRVFLNEVEAKLSKQSLSKKKGYSSLRLFLDEMNVLIPAYEHILQKFQTTPLDSGKKRAGAASEG